MVNNLKKTGWIKGYSGNKFHIFNPKVSDVNIYDIAHSLARLCRFNGTVDCDIYSVAQHSVIVSHIDKHLFPLEKLLHDGTESVVGDVVRPLKIWLDDFPVYEEKVDRVIARAFKLSRTKKCLAEVKRADNIALVTEARDLLTSTDALSDYCPDVQPLPWKIKPWGVKKSEREFLKRFFELTSFWKHSMAFSEFKIENFKWKSIPLKNIKFCENIRRRT